MMITLELDTVDLAQIAASGQCFRMAPLEDGRWLVPMGRWMATARQRDARRIELSADGEDGTFLDAARRYFDADTDYLTAIRAIDPSDAYLSAAAEAGRGIRILRQPLFETLISFIVSQNNNIPRIRTIIAKLCGRYELICRFADGTICRNGIAFYEENRIHIASGESGAFYIRGTEDNVQENP